jgi:hypothetical protein
VKGSVPCFDSGFLSILVELSCEKEGDKKKRTANRRRTEEGGPGLKMMQVHHLTSLLEEQDIDVC